MMKPNKEVELVIMLFRLAWYFAATVGRYVKTMDPDAADCYLQSIEVSNRIETDIKTLITLKP